MYTFLFSCTLALVKGRGGGGEVYTDLFGRTVALVGGGRGWLGLGEVYTYLFS